MRRIMGRILSHLGGAGLSWPGLAVAATAADSWGAASAGTTVGILNELEEQLTELAHVTRPIYTRTQALTWARRNIKQVQRRADEVLGHMDVSRKVGRACLLMGQPCLCATHPGGATGL